MVLPDTSAWITYFRDGRSAEAEHLSALIESEEVATCGPVVAELIAGSSDEQRALLLDTVPDLPWALLDLAGWTEVGDVASRLRRAGKKLPLTDLAIAVAAARAGHALWTFDSDFRRLGSVLPELELHQAS